jgi:hypothetical protein
VWLKMGLVKLWLKVAASTSSSSTSATFTQATCYVTCYKRQGQGKQQLG